MTVQSQLKLIVLRRQLSKASPELLAAQRRLEHAEKKYGMTSGPAVQAAQHCKDLSLRFSKLQEEYLALRSAQQEEHLTLRSANNT